jgi:tRNA G18 (ribose-2'-O)-methylase SpoU
MSDDLVYGIHAVLAVLAKHPARVDEVWLGTTRDDRRRARFLPRVVCLLPIVAAQ